MYVGLMLLHFQDYFLSFKFHTHDFFKHSKRIRNERDILFERKGYNVFFSCLNHLFFLSFFLLLLILFLSLSFFVGMKFVNYYISTTSFIMHFLRISVFLFTYYVYVCTWFSSFIDWCTIFHIYPLFMFMFIYLFVLTFFLSKWSRCVHG